MHHSTLRTNPARDLFTLQVRKFLPEEKGFKLGDVKAAVAAVHFILAHATRHDVQEGVLNEELQQLGLPRENADGISRPFRANAGALRKAMTRRTLSLPALEALQWRVDLTLASSRLASVASPALHVKLCTSHSLHTQQPRLTSQQLGVAARLSGKAPQEGGPTPHAHPSDTAAAALLSAMDKARASLAALGTPAGHLTEVPSAAPTAAGWRGETHHMVITHDKLLGLLSELRTARQLMQQASATVQSGPTSAS